jgi:hypothetical protein
VGGTAYQVSETLLNLTLSPLFNFRRKLLALSKSVLEKSIESGSGDHENPQLKHFTDLDAIVSWRKPHLGHLTTLNLMETLDFFTSLCRGP